jgi:hypothetical protein
MITGVLAGSLLVVAACGFPTQTTFGVGNDGGLRTLVIPDDAEVFIDGGSMGAASQYRGRTFIQMKGGTHVVEIKKSGYADYREEVFVKGNIITMTLTLKKE